MSITTQTYIEADVPSVFIYNNYIMYDRWMSYKRLNRTKDEYLTKKEYYYKNYIYFLVLKYYKQKSGDFYVILYDTVYNKLYSNKSYIYTHDVKVDIEYSDFYKQEIPYITIINSNSKWCFGKKDRITHKYLIEDEFKDINIDRLLSFHEFSNLPEFVNNFYKDFDENYVYEEEDYEEEDYEEDYKYSENYDSEYYDYEDEIYNKSDYENYYDYDDRMHGPEHTIEDCDLDCDLDSD